MAVSFSVMVIVLLHFASMKVIWTVFSFINGWCSAYITSSLLSKSKEKRGRFSFQCSSGAEKKYKQRRKKGSRRKMPIIGQSPKVSAWSAMAVCVAPSKNLEKENEGKPQNMEIAKS
jgi:hypothetical protein